MDPDRRRHARRFVHAEFCGECGLNALWGRTSRVDQGFLARLWVVICAIWTVSVVVPFAVPHWPVGTLVSESEVFDQMSPDTSETFVDCPYWRDKPVGM